MSKIPNDNAISEPVTKQNFTADSGNKGKMTLKKSRSYSNEVNDYIFIKSHRRKKKKYTSPDIDSDEVELSDAYPLVASNHRRSNTKKSDFQKKKAKTKHKMKTYKKVLISIACIFVVLILGCFGTYFFLVNSGKTELFPSELSITGPSDSKIENNGEYVTYKGHKYAYNNKMTSVLCMGIDKRDFDDKAAVDNKLLSKNGQSDVLELISIDTSTGKISIINISRETMADVAVYSDSGDYIEMKNMQICMSYAYGNGKETSCENTVSSVKNVFYNIPIQSYLSLDLDGIAAINDSVGGIDVTSPETIGDFVKGQTYHLVSNQAESFVRIRDTEKITANNERMARQQEYIKSFMNKTIAQTKKNIMTPINLYNSANKYLCTNLNPSKITYLAQSFVTNRSSTGIDTMTVPGVVKMGDTYAEYHINEEKFYEMFLGVFYNKLS